MIHNIHINMTEIADKLNSLHYFFFLYSWLTENFFVETILAHKYFSN